MNFPQFLIAQAVFSAAERFPQRLSTEILLLEQVLSDSILGMNSGYL